MMIVNYYDHHMEVYLMLLRYIVSNFKSIGSEVEFCMFPSDNNNYDDRFLKTIDTKAGKWKILKRGAFFGPNASGKSTFIESLEFARNFIIDGQKTGQAIHIDQYRGNLDDKRHMSKFQFMFYLNEEVYEYGFLLNRKQVCEEWLMIMTDEDFKPLFTRTTDENGKTEIILESEFAIKDPKERELAEVLKDSIKENQKNQLYLYKLYDNGVKEVESVLGWFKCLRIIFPTSKPKGFPIQLESNSEFEKFIADSLRKLDTGINAISILNKEIDFMDLLNEIDIPQNIIKDIEDMENGIVSINGKYFIFCEDKNKRTIMLQIQFEHKLNDTTVMFDIEDESDGTKRLLDLLPILFSLTQKGTFIYFVDEIDRSLHTKLSKFLLDQFVSESDDSFNQIIFTAHDTNLINLSDFRQEEIWFIEKNSLGQSKLKPMSNFDLKKDHRNDSNK